MKRKLLASILAVAMLFALAACGGEPAPSGSGEPNQSDNGGQSANQGGSGETISLRVWGAEEDQALLKDLVEKFKQTYSDQTFDIQIGVESESKAKDDILTDVTAAADVYAFACDQLADLVAAGAILPLDDNMDQVLQAYANKTLADVKAENSEGSIGVATLDGQLYAFPFSADGYFMFYDPSVINMATKQS